MNTILTIKDIELITNFYRKINDISKEIMINITENIGKNKIVAACVINGEINSLITVNLIKNNYYLEHFKYLVFKQDELTSLLNFLINYLSENPEGMSVLFDNSPFKDIYDSILVSAGFKYNFLNYTNDPSKEKIEVFNFNFLINDKSLDVKEYLLQNYQKTAILNDKYLGTCSHEMTPEVNLDNTNIVVIRNNQNQVIGVSRFGLVSDEMFINSLYADNEETYLEILKIIKSLTSRRIQIGILPVRIDLINILNNHGYLISQADYIKGVNN